MCLVPRLFRSGTGWARDYMAGVKGLAGRLRLPQAVGEQAEELFRLVDVKGGMASGRGLNGATITLACIELACSRLGEPLDKNEALKLSGVGAKAYRTAYQAVSQVLGVTSALSLTDFAVRFGCVEAEPLANRILESYKCLVDSKYTAAQLKEVDLSKPLYLLTALHSACRLLKIHCDKERFMSAAACSRPMFQRVLKEMTSCKPENIDDFRSQKRTKKKKADHSPAESTQQPSPRSQSRSRSHSPASQLPTGSREALHCRIQSNPLSSEYLQWRERVLREAREHLQHSAEKTRAPV